MTYCKLLYREEIDSDIVDNDILYGMYFRGATLWL